jgi:hypothetical protein
MDNINSDLAKFKICCIGLISDCIKWCHTSVIKVRGHIRSLYEDIRNEIKNKE